MTSPIQNRIGQVFIPVSDIERAIAWYSQLFGLPRGSTSHGDTIYDIPVLGETRLALDGSPRPVTNSSQPICFFWTDDIVAARRHLEEMRAVVLSDIEDIGSVSFLAFADPDGNRLMVCQRNG